ncbi:uncharacterized protein LOC114525468 [Dendronephthya gigantea]|uniref:uncharacterized protein LOC114525468 n=1 Tax=Dendronephthya gigantea TaxID=151771 RepID=UPI001068F31B|nr:uncharacterized protein LOC114525468 [Dendronephthya gigantea]
MFFPDVAGFFVKHIKTGMCIYDTARIQSQGPDWGSVSFLELSNNCLDPAAQFRFRDNGAMLNLKRQGCLAIYQKKGQDEMFWVYVPATPKIKEKSACANKRVIEQTSSGGLRGFYNSAARCADPDGYIKTNVSCLDGKNKRFNFGSVTCYGKTTENVTCPKDQFMVVKTASYRGLSDSKTCGLNDDYSCTVDVTCLVKKQCDGQHECKITVNETLFSDYLCPGLKKYLYFEYQCIDTSKQYSLCVDNVHLSNSTLPNEGFIQLVTERSGTKTVCWQSLKNNAKDVVCRQLGYTRASSLVHKTGSSDVKDSIFSGSIDCDGGEIDLSECSMNAFVGNCSGFSYIKCHICDNPLLEDKERFPDTSFTASVSSEGHRASDARISSGSSWCASVSDGKHYLQVDLGRLYVLYNVTTFGDSTSAKWVKTYNLNNTVDLKSWKQVQAGSGKIFQGNKNAYNDAAIRSLNDIKTRALRFTPLSHEDQPCMRIEICGDTLYPDQPRNLIVFNIKSRSVEISWIDPENQGFSSVSRFWIKMKKNDSLILNIKTGKMNKYKIDKLTPYTNYEISVAAGNKDGFGEETSSSFITLETAPSGPPLNIKTTSRSTSSLSFIWDPPEESKQNGVIISYTVCVSNTDDGICFHSFTTTERNWVARDLNPSTKYYIRVQASTKAGRGNYSESKGFFTNGGATEEAADVTSSTLKFSLKIPSMTYLHFYVVALKLKDGKEPKSSGSYDNNELVTYAEARKSSDPKPYIAAVFTSGDVNENVFILGDGKNTSDLTSRRRRSTASDYYNGPLESGTRYSIFQRMILNDQDYYSTDWSPVSKTKMNQLVHPKVVLVC